MLPRLPLDPAGRWPDLTGVQVLKTVSEIIAMFGGIDGLYVSIENPPFMRLVIEHIGNGPHDLPTISVAHYFEMNGDVCQDPEMLFRDRDHARRSRFPSIHVSNGGSSDLPGGNQRCARSHARRRIASVCGHVGCESSSARLYRCGAAAPDSGAPGPCRREASK